MQFYTPIAAFHATDSLLSISLAVLQMQILVATFVMRYDLVLRDPLELKSVEGFMHKPVDLWARVYKRGAQGRKQ